MPFVLDASMTLSWGFEDEFDESAAQARGALLADFAVAPALWRLEVANGLWVAQRRARLTAADADGFWSDLQKLDIRVEDAPDATRVANLLNLARTHNLTIYDAAYLELAGRAAIPIASRDRRLRDGATSAGIPLAFNAI